MAMNLLALVRRAASLMSSDLPLPSTLINGPGDYEAQWVAVAWDVTQDLLEREHNWQALTKELVFTTLPTEDQGLLSTLAPDFHRWINETQNDRSRNLKVVGISSQAWQTYKAGVISPFNPTLRVVQGRIKLLGNTVGGAQVATEYLSNGCVLAFNGIPKTDFSVDTDTCVWSDALMVAGLKWKFQENNGLDYSEAFRQYEDLVQKAIARDRPRETLSLARRRSNHLPFPVIPENGFG